MFVCGIPEARTNEKAPRALSNPPHPRRQRGFCTSKLHSAHLIFIYLHWHLLQSHVQLLIRPIQGKPLTRKHRQGRPVHLRTVRSDPLGFSSRSFSVLAAWKTSQLTRSAPDLASQTRQFVSLLCCIHCALHSAPPLPSNRTANTD